MIKKTILTFVILLLAYAVLRSVYYPQMNLEQANFHANSIRAQGYLFNDADATDAIIVGSSLSAYFRMDSLPTMYNLAFGGESSYIGLELITKKKKFPKTVYIESNFLFRVDESELTAKFNDPYLYPLKEQVPIIREGKEPLLFFNRLVVERVADRIIPAQLPSFDNSDMQTDNGKEDLNSKMKQVFIEKYSLEPTEEVVNKAISNLKYYIDILEKNGTEVRFFEMPFEQDLQAVIFFTKTREVLEQTFPDSKYAYIYPPQYESYKTTDGLHLEYFNAVRYTVYMRQQADSLDRNRMK